MCEINLASDDVSLRDLKKYSDNFISLIIIIKSKNLVDPPELADRISKLAYDTDIGKPHIELIDNSYAVSGGAVTACPVSAVGFGGGCYRVEEIEVDGTVELRVSLDTQPCIELSLIHI